MQKLLSILAGPWTFYILHVLRTEGPTRFGALRRRIPGISSKVLTERLRLLEQENFIYRHYEPKCREKLHTDRLNGSMSSDRCFARSHDWRRFGMAERTSR